MSASVEVDEVNGAGLVLSHGILNTHHGSVDAINLDPVANPVPAGANGYEKWQRLHLAGLGGSSVVRYLHFWSGTARPAGLTFQFNGHVTQATYDGSKKTAAEQPGTGATKTPNSVPTTSPASANIGIGGQLTGTLSAPGSTDYVVSQMRVAGGTLPQAFDPTVNYDYEEVG